ncbi:S8 family serine peptidase [Paenibacillus sp. FSL R7-0128]|uniref:S8 family serine peptidase n=1 Tax=Paenibacillus sp. FSL R7-0128 TaxID=2954529 RepID=UPI0030FBB64B
MKKRFVLIVSFLIICSTFILIFLIFGSVESVNIPQSQYIYENKNSINNLVENSEIKDLMKHFKGEGMNIAIIDSGIYEHRDFDSRIIKFVDFINGNLTPYDDFGHGTEVAGIIAGDGSLSNGVNVGIAPQSNLVVLKVFDSKGKTDLNRLKKAINWVSENRKLYNIKVLTLSLGYGFYEDYQTDPLYGTIINLINQGVLVVTSAGNTNFGDFRVSAPGNIPEVLSVGSTSMIKINLIEDSTKETVSKKPNLYAPGRNIITTNTPLGALRKSDENYVSVSGTSYSAAIVSGIALLLFEKYENITISKIFEIIKNISFE